MSRGPKLPLLGWLDRSAPSPWKLPLLCGVLLAASYYAPLPILNLVFLLPLAYKLDAARDPRPRSDFRAGFTMGTSATLIGMHFWIVPAVEQTWLAALLWLLLSGALGLRFGLTWMLVGWLRRRTGWTFGFLLPAVWVPLEWLEGSIPDLRMTADHLAHGLAGFPFLVQFADLVGHYGVTAVLLATVGLLYDALFGARVRRRPVALVLATLVAAVLAYDGWAWTRERPASGSTRVALVQPNIPLVEKRDDGGGENESSTLARLTRVAAASEPDLIVWPESAWPEPVGHWLDRPETRAIPEVAALAREAAAALLVGAVYGRVRAPGDYDLYNAALAIDASGRMLEDWAAKVYLVPFVEATPFRALLGPLVAGREGGWRWLAGTFEPGPRDVVIEVAGARVGVLVCYEELFPELSRRLRNAGAEFQVLITNDAWWGRTAFQQYLVDALRLRAIESRTDIVRVANTGISGFVDRRGRYRQMTPLFEEAVEVADVVRSSGRTVHDRTGDAIVWLALTGAAIAAVRARRALGGSPGRGGSDILS